MNERKVLFGLSFALAGLLVNKYVLEQTNFWPWFENHRLVIVGAIAVLLFALWLPFRKRPSKTVVVIILIAISCSPLKAQQITPPIVEYSQLKVSDSFEIKNASETQPLTVVALTAKAFTVDGKTGDPAFIDVDPTKISLKLGEQSAHIPPLGSHQFEVQARCLQSSPCWFTVFASIAVGRASNGVLVTVVLGHTCYLGQGSIKRKDVQVSFINGNSFEIVNSGAGLDRPLIELWTAAGKKTFGIPIFPNGTRIVASESPISRVRVKFAKSTINAKP